MELLWYTLLLVMIAGYIILDGYDFGAGIIHLFFAKSEKEKSSIVKSIGPFWDANEVWLLAGGGVLFFAFPTLYASSFSGFYLPLIMILWLLIFRAIGLELRGQVNNQLWKDIWDKAFGIASLLLALFFGVALGNVVRGVNLGIVSNGVSTQEAHYFFLPIWNPTFSPHSEHLGVIDWFTLLLGVIAVVTLTIHGANWILLKTDTTLNERLKKIIFYANILLTILIVFSIIIWHYIEPSPFDNFIKYPWLWIFPILTISAVIGQFGIMKFKKEGYGFILSSIFILCGLLTTTTSIFPNMLPSTNEVNPSLTLYNTKTTDYGLEVGIVWFSIAFVLLIAYTIIQHSVFRGKLDDIDYHDDH